jgi:hypothetical protein
MRPKALVSLSQPPLGQFSDAENDPKLAPEFSDCVAAAKEEDGFLAQELRKCPLVR